MAVNTAKVANRRTLHFANFQEVLREAEQLAAGKYTTLGNHSYGQILKHLAIGMTASIDGGITPAPWFVRWLAPLFKKKIIRGPMSAGFNLSPTAESELWPGETSTADGLDALRKAIRRLETETTRAPSPFLGKLTREESDQLHLRHSELHLSFVVPELV